MYLSNDFFTLTFFSFFHQVSYVFIRSCCTSFHSLIIQCSTTPWQPLTMPFQSAPSTSPQHDLVLSQIFSALHLTCFGSFKLSFLYFYTFILIFLFSFSFTFTIYHSWLVISIKWSDKPPPTPLLNCTSCILPVIFLSTRNKSIKPLSILCLHHMYLWTALLKVCIYNSHAW